MTLLALAMLAALPCARFDDPHHTCAPLPFGGCGCAGISRVAAEPTKGAAMKAKQTKKRPAKGGKGKGY